MSLIAIVCMLSLIAVCASGSYVWWVGRAPMTAHRCIVTLASSEAVALRGIWWRQRGPWIVLRDVAALPPQGPAVPMDGEVVVHRQNVAFVQVLLNGGEQLRSSG